MLTHVACNVAINFTRTVLRNVEGLNRLATIRQSETFKVLLFERKNFYAPQSATARKHSTRSHSRDYENARRHGNGLRGNWERFAFQLK